jgi:hypothetical protein
VIQITSRPTPTQLTARIRGGPRKICFRSTIFALNPSFENDGEMTSEVPRIADSKKGFVLRRYSSTGCMASELAVAIVNTRQKQKKRVGARGFFFEPSQ